MTSGTERAQRAWGAATLAFGRSAFTTNKATGSYTCASMDTNTLVGSSGPRGSTTATTVGDALDWLGSEGSGVSMSRTLWIGSASKAISAPRLDEALA